MSERSCCPPLLDWGDGHARVQVLAGTMASLDRHTKRGNIDAFFSLRSSLFFHIVASYHFQFSRLSSCRSSASSPFFSFVRSLCFFSFHCFSFFPLMSIRPLFVWKKREKKWLFSQSPFFCSFVYKCTWQNMCTHLGSSTVKVCCRGLRVVAHAC